MILLAYKELGDSLIEGECKNLVYRTECEDLVFQALIGLDDPARDDVKEYIKSCREAGIDVKMITG